VVDNRQAAKVFEIDGRLIIRTVNETPEGIGVVDDESVVLDGFPEVPVNLIGKAVKDALRRCRTVPRPNPWPLRSEFAAPLLALSPKRYRSYRAWLRASREATVRKTPNGLFVERLYPDLATGTRSSTGYLPGYGYQRTVQLQRNASAMLVGAAIVRVLQQPPVRDLPDR
jgi:hypothetical protein